MIPFDQAKQELSKSPDPISDILRTSAYWATLQLLYVELLKNKDLIPLSELSRERKNSYWSQVRDMDCKHYKRIWICQALYCYDFIKNEP